ncbi:hypothetical protein [Haladaptatus salinisoli]|uniref:hypothetical protein n=1 Tax=Haladaptatus salinisoli TaxID=2884876 RepID=UPI001D0B15A2|nr:hypothetical protein [Haladaptatus salinisoli]
MADEFTERQLQYIGALLMLLLVIEFYRLLGFWGVVGGTLAIFFLRGLYFGSLNTIYSAAFGRRN